MRTTVTPARHMMASFALVVAFALPNLALAQTQPSEDDLRALRYYTSLNQTDAVAAETRRLQQAFPGWVPSADPGKSLPTGPTSEVDAIYAGIASGDLAGARSLLGATRVKFPTWIPPADMLSLLDVADAQAGFDAAIASGNAQEALRVAIATPALLRCDRINNTWRVAELQAQAGNSAGALMAYRQILTVCTNLPDIVATLEKADAVASPDELGALTAQAQQRFPGSAPLFTALQTRLLAGRGTAAPGGKKVARKAGPTGAALATGSAPAANAEAPRLKPRNETGRVLNGLPRHGDGRLGQTRAAAKAGNFADCLARSSQPGSLDLVYERAWCAYNLDRSLEALAQFTAAANGGLGGTVTRDARYGLALSYLKRAMTEEAAQVAAATDFTLTQRKEVESQILDQRGVQAYQQQRYRDAIAFLDAKEAMDGSLRRDLAIMEAYSFLKMGDKIEALRRFTRLDNDLSTKETHAGLQASR